MACQNGEHPQEVHLGLLSPASGQECFAQNFLPGRQPSRFSSCLGEDFASPIVATALLLTRSGRLSEPLGADTARYKTMMHRFSVREYGKPAKTYGHVSRENSCTPLYMYMCMCMYMCMYIYMCILYVILYIALRPIRLLRFSHFHLVSVVLP